MGGGKGVVIVRTGASLLPPVVSDMLEADPIEGTEHNFANSLFKKDNCS